MAETMFDNTDPYLLTATEALALIKSRKLSALEWVESCRERIRSREPDIQAWACLNDSIIEETKSRAQKGFAIPVGVKDIIDVLGLPTMMGANFHDAAPATREGGSVALMREAGCVFMGKTVTTELGHRHPGPTRNPRNLAHTPGGSSSGSAAAVADFMVPLCLGTQTTASVIRPAAFCGVIGYKPTYGDFDKTGVLANAPSMDSLGIIARSIEDLWLLRGMLLDEPHKTIKPNNLSKVRFALLTVSPWEKADEETRDLIENFMDQIVSKGMKRVDIDLEHELKRLMELHRLISGFEFRRSIAFERTRHLNQLSAILREGRLADGQELDIRGYQAAIQETALLRTRLAEVFKEVDIIVSPSAPGPAPLGLESTGDAVFSTAWSLVGNPAITLPLFVAASGLPIGIQFFADMAKDDMLLATSKSVFDIFGSRI